MSLFKFVKNIFQNKSIELYNRGEHYRDFTYVDDVVKYVLGLIKTKIKNNKVVPFEIYNIGNGKFNNKAERHNIRRKRNGRKS